MAKANRQPAPPAAEPAERWQYLRRHEPRERVDDVLASAGADGWELVGFQAGAFWELVFKRRVQ